MKDDISILLTSDGKGKAEKLQALMRIVAQKDAALKGVINSACHPDIAIRAVMVDLQPVRAALATDALAE